MTREQSILRGRGPGGLHQNSLEIDFIVVSDRGSDIYQQLLVPWKNIVPSRNYRLCGIVRAIFNRAP